MVKVTELSDDDKARIKDSEFYLHAKKIMKSFESYGPVQVGEVYSIFYLNHENKVRYVKRGGSNSLKDRFLVIHKDEGFVFAKRINANGDLSKDVICLTIRFPSESYSLELDSDQAESIIFQDEAAFDPFKQGKELSKKKNKARRLNKTKVVEYDTADKAFDFISTIKIGDTLFDSSTAFGEGIVEWKVTDVQKRATDKTPQTDWNNRVYTYGNTQEDQKHFSNGLNTFISIQLTAVSELPFSRRWISKTKICIFTDFMTSKRKYRDYYLSRPISVDEV